MRANRSILAKLCLLAALAVPVQRSASANLSQRLPQAPSSALLLAQAASTELPFTPPASFDGTQTLLIDGSSSMRNMNAALSEQFQERYEEAEVDSAANGSDIAIERLINGEIDIAAIGRPLTEAEAEADLSVVEIAREKIAIIVSPDNPFAGDITFEQFGQIFRGELTDWSELGGEPGPIRFVDRPTFSDTREAFRPYPVFQAAPFETGFTADPVAVDETDAVIEALGSDGIGYAIANQVIDRDDVSIISMHQTLPDNPAYPFSQPRSYVYASEAPSPAAQGFLGVVTGTEGQTAIEAVRDTEAAAAVAIEGPRPTATSPDGSLIATTNENNVAIIEDDSGNLVAGPLAGAGGAVTALAFSENGETLATGTNKGNVRYWDTEGNPLGEAFSVTAGDSSKAVTAISFDGNNEITASSEGNQGKWGLNGLPPGEVATAAAAAEATTDEATTDDEEAAAGIPFWPWLLPLLGVIGAGLWLLLGKKRDSSSPEAIRQTAPTATVPPPATDPITDREVSNRAQSVISTDRVTDESRAIENTTASPAADAPDVPLPVGLPGLNTETATPPSPPLYESTDLESPDLEGTNLDLLTPTAAIGGAAALGVGGMMLGDLDAGVETNDDDDEWDDNLDLTLDDESLSDTDDSVPTPTSSATVLQATTAADTSNAGPSDVGTLSGDLWDSDTAASTPEIPEPVAAGLDTPELETSEIESPELETADPGLS
ncbi:MAG: substrate-binding domain-containing protein, partial [Cyanobacteria bacterium J06607_13]